MKTLRVVHNKKVNEIAVLFHNEIAFTADLTDIDNVTRFVDHLGRHENVPAEEVGAALVRLNDIYWNHVA